MIVYLSEFIHPEAVAKLSENVKVVNNFDEIEKIDAIIMRGINVTREMMEKATNLKVIAKHGVGTNTIDIQAAKELGIKVIYTPTANINSVAELIVGLIINLNRDICLANKNSREGVYKTIAPPELIGLEVKGKTLGLVGMGNIAKIVANILIKGFDVKVVGYDPYITSEKALEAGINKFDDLIEMLRVSDFVNVSVPLTNSTRNLISGDMFDYFKPNAILINAARGGVVNEDDLYEALVNKKLKAAACDAFVNEPPTVQNCKLLSLDNFIATPHIGGNTQEALYRAGMEVVEETLNVLSGKEPIHPAY
ncbi:MAG: hydroxyacid dehydrogenase [Peptococcales bacterium]